MYQFKDEEYYDRDYLNSLNKEFYDCQIRTDNARYWYNVRLDEEARVRKELLHVLQSLWSHGTDASYIPPEDTELYVDTETPVNWNDDSVEEIINENEEEIIAEGFFNNVGQRLSSMFKRTENIA